MKRIIGLIILTMVLSAATGYIAHGQTNNRSVKRVEKSITGKKRKAPKGAKVREPKTVVRAKKEQEKREAEKDKAYEKAVKQNKKRQYEIQTDEVKARMKQNEKDIKLRDREKKKRERQSARESGASRKYRKK